MAQVKNEEVTLLAKFYKYSTGEGKGIFIVDQSHEDSYRTCQKIERKMHFHNVKNPKVLFKHKDTQAYFIHINMHVALFGASYMQFLYYTIVFEPVLVNQHMIFKMKQRENDLKVEKPPAAGTK